MIGLLLNPSIYLGSTIVAFVSGYLIATLLCAYIMHKAAKPEAKTLLSTLEKVIAQDMDKTMSTQATESMQDISLDDTYTSTPIPTNRSPTEPEHLFPTGQNVGPETAPARDITRDRVIVIYKTTGTTVKYLNNTGDTPEWSQKLRQIVAKYLNKPDVKNVQVHEATDWEELRSKANVEQEVDSVDNTLFIPSFEDIIDDYDPELLRLAEQLTEVDDEEQQQERHARNTETKAQRPGTPPPEPPIRVVLKKPTGVSGKLLKIPPATREEDPKTDEQLENDLIRYLNQLKNRNFRLTPQHHKVLEILEKTKALRRQNISTDDPAFIELRQQLIRLPTFSDTDQPSYKAYTDEFPTLEEIATVEAYLLELNKLPHRTREQDDSKRLAALLLDGLAERIEKSKKTKSLPSGQGKFNQTFRKFEAAWRQELYNLKNEQKAERRKARALGGKQRTQDILDPRAVDIELREYRAHIAQHTLIGHFEQTVDWNVTSTLLRSIRFRQGTTEQWAHARAAEFAYNYHRIIQRFNLHKQHAFAITPALDSQPLLVQLESYKHKLNKNCEEYYKDEDYQLAITVIDSIERGREISDWAHLATNIFIDRYLSTYLANKGNTFAEARRQQLPEESRLSYAPPLGEIRDYLWAQQGKWPALVHGDRRGYSLAVDIYEALQDPVPADDKILRDNCIEFRDEYLAPFNASLYSKRGDDPNKTDDSLAVAPSVGSEDESHLVPANIREGNPRQAETPSPVDAPTGPFQSLARRKGIECSRPCEPLDPFNTTWRQRANYAQHAQIDLLERSYPLQCSTCEDLHYGIPPSLSSIDCRRLLPSGANYKDNQLVITYHDHDIPPLHIRLCGYCNYRLYTSDEVLEEAKRDRRLLCRRTSERYVDVLRYQYTTSLTLTERLQDGDESD